MVAIDAKYMRILQKIGDRVKDNFTRIICLLGSYFYLI